MTEREIDEATVEGYRREPQADAEVAAAVAFLRASLLAEPW